MLFTCQATNAAACDLLAGVLIAAQNTVSDVLFAEKPCPTCNRRIHFLKGTQRPSGLRYLPTPTTRNITMTIHTYQKRAFVLQPRLCNLLPEGIFPLLLPAYASYPELAV